MKIIMSPSKTKKLAGMPLGDCFAPEKTMQIVAHMKGLSVEEMMKALKIKEELALQLKDFYENYEKKESGKAISSFTGLAFKNLDWESLSEEAQRFGEEHLCMLSALYGVVEPSSPIKEYRLDLVNLIHKYSAETVVSENLTKFWKEDVTAYFAEEDWILNLASQEYSALVSHPKMVTVSFLEKAGEQWKQKSTSSKMMRGQFVRYILEHGITARENLPESIGEFTRDYDVETEETISYKKNRK